MTVIKARPLARCFAALTTAIRCDDGSSSRCKPAHAVINGT